MLQKIYIFIALGILGCFCILLIHFSTKPPMSSQFLLLTDPFLQFPTQTSVRVVWLTEFAGLDHIVSYGEKLSQTAIARTTQLSRTREDSQSWVDTQQADGTVFPTTTRAHLGEVSSRGNQQVT